MKAILCLLILCLLAACSRFESKTPNVTTRNDKEISDPIPIEVNSNQEESDMDIRRKAFPDFYASVKLGTHLIPNDYSSNLISNYSDYYDQSVWSINGNRFFETNDSVYFSYPHLFVWNKETKETKLLYDGTTSKVVVYKNRVYFMKLENTVEIGGFEQRNEWALCSLDLQGNDFRYEIKEKVNSAFYLHENLLFLTVGDLADGMYKTVDSRLAYLNLDNHELVITDLNIAPVSFAMHDRQLYFMEEADNQIKSYHLDTKEVKKYDASTSSYLFFFRNKIYFNEMGQLKYLDVITDQIKNIGQFTIPNSLHMLITDDFIFFDSPAEDDSMKMWYAYKINSDEFYELPNLITEYYLYQIAYGKIFSFTNLGVIAYDFSGNKETIVSKEHLEYLIAKFKKK